MSVISKQLFYEKISSELKCRNLHYWNRNCAKSQVWFLSTVFVGSLKFFLPIYIVKALINSRKFKEKNFWISLLLGQIRSSVYGALMGSLFLGGNCLLCNLTGRLHYYNISIVAGLFSGLSLLVETKENKTLDTLIFFNLLVEAFFRNLANFNLPTLTVAKETMLFMAVSSLLMFLLQSRKKSCKFTHFWFYTPDIQKKNSKATSKAMLEQSCVHEGFCVDFTLEGIQKYFLLGYGFSIVRKIIPTMLSVIRNPMRLSLIVFNKDNVKFGAFIGAYVGVYRSVMCYLLKTNGLKQKYFGALAGLLAGATYSISPNLQVLSVAITTVLQIAYNAALKKMQVKNRLIPQQLVYMLCHSLLLHNAILSKETCPAYYVNMLNIATNNVYPQIYNEVITKHFLS